MSKYVLFADTTLCREYRNFPLLDFLPCAPRSLVPNTIYNYLKGRLPPAINGRAVVAPYAIRKLEAALLQENSSDEVVVPHEDYIEQFIDSATQVIAVSTMDPLGLGPLTISYPIFFGVENYPYVKKEFEALMARLNRARKGTKAKLVVGGSGVWEFMVFPEELNRLGIDFAFHGEADDIACILFKEIAEDSFSTNIFFKGFQTFDNEFHKFWSNHDRFLSRRQFSKQYPKLEEIPEIRSPAVKGMVEVMRGCGIGCDFCEVTLRPIRYYPPEKVRKEIMVNIGGGYHNAWLHSDEIFAYEHGKNFTPNPESLAELFTTVMSVDGIGHTNPTHGRISIPAAYPDLIRTLATIIRAEPSNWIGIQMGLETGSDRLAKIHMPNKTLPLKIGSDGSWKQIVWQGTHNLNLHYWRPAFTVQVGQVDETPEDNWETVVMIGSMSSSEVAGRPFEFTVTPMQNVPLGLLKSMKFSQLKLDESQLAVYYASYKHLARITTKNFMGHKRWSHVPHLGTSAIIALGGWAMYEVVRKVCKKRGLDTEKVDRYFDRRVAQVIA